MVPLMQQLLHLQAHCVYKLATTMRAVCVDRSLNNVLTCSSANASCLSGVVFEGMSASVPLQSANAN